MIGALGLDYSRLIAARTELQVTADLAAHSALYYRESNSAAAAKAKAIELVNTGMPNSDFGEVLAVGDIYFGVWDYATLSFTLDPTSDSGVMVTTSRSAAKANAVSTYLFRLIGLQEFDVVTEAVFTTYHPDCLREGFVADAPVEMQSNNTFTAGFCVHSNQYASLNISNTFEDGSIVSMPNEGSILMPDNGFNANDGLEEALRSAAYRLRIVAKIGDIITGLESGDPKYIPDYIINNTPVTMSGKHFTDTDFDPGYIYRIPCVGKAFIQGFGPIRDVVIMTSCELKFGEGTVLEDVIVTNTSTGASSFNAPASIQLGRNDNCATGGGAQLITQGGVSFAADFRAYGGQIIAKGDVEFSANASGIEGVSIVSGGTISGTSNMTMGFCGGAGMENNFEAEYFRLAG